MTTGKDDWDYLFGPPESPPPESPEPAPDVEPSVSEKRRVWFSINDRDGGTGKRGRWWMQLVLCGLITVGPVWRIVAGDETGVIDWVFLGWLLVWAGWVVGARLWWLRHRRGVVVEGGPRPWVVGLGVLVLVGLLGWWNPDVPRPFGPYVRNDQPKSCWVRSLNPAVTRPNPQIPWCDPSVTVPN